MSEEAIFGEVVIENAIVAAIHFLRVASADGVLLCEDERNLLLAMVMSPTIGGDA